MLSAWRAFSGFGIRHSAFFRISAFGLRIFLLLLIAAGCAGKPKPDATSKEPASIGVAWMENDGTLVMQLRAQEPGKAVGDVQLRYKPTDAEYHRMLDHIGGIQPGQTKPVPPWPPGENNKSP